MEIEIIKLAGVIIAAILGSGFVLKICINKKNKRNNIKQVIKNGNNNIQAGGDVNNVTNEVK